MKKFLLCIFASSLFCLFVFSAFGKAQSPLDESLPGTMPGSCVLEARTDVELKVYEENNQGKQGILLWEGKLLKNQRKDFSSSTERLRYDYRVDPSDPFHGDVGCWRRSGGKVTVP